MPLRLPPLPSRTVHEVSHHFRLLVEVGLATSAYTSSDDRHWIALRLTWEGHDYLDKIRDPHIWRFTKTAMSQAGAWSLETMGAIAKAAILSKLEAMGIGASA